MSAMQPSDLPDTDLDSMNRDHEDQVEMINAVLTAIEAHDGSEPSVQAVDEALEDFAGHTQEHFSQERDQMLRYQFPAFAMHDAEHQRALERMEAVMVAWNEKRDLETLAAYMRREFPSWLIGHVSAMDVFAAQYVAGNAH